MIFSLKPIMLKHLYSWLKCHLLEIFVFVLLWAHGSTLGMSDDEAYYWVLAQRPALGYAYHPPAVAWVISFFQHLTSWALDSYPESRVRLPAALGSALILGLSLNWMVRSGLKKELRLLAGLLLLSFYGFFGLSWMMVPDIPLFFGWTLLFVSTWAICFEAAKLKDFLILFAGSQFLILSKYSGILGVFSSVCALWIWAPRLNRIRGIFVLFIATIVAIVPIIVWNFHHDWGSLLYQLRDRHSDSQISGMRWIKFGLIEILLTSPFLMILFYRLFARLRSNPILVGFLIIWWMPAGFVFLIQPLFSDFKPHWALIAWWPLVLGVGRFADAEIGSIHRIWKIIFRVQIGYGLGLGALLLLACHIPLMSLISGQKLNPNFDVTNDLFGWRELPSFLSTHLKPSDKDLPIVGSRYQTASQTAFYLAKHNKSITLIPRDLKELDEWPKLPQFESQGPQWPRLLSPVLSVTDQRYQQPPAFPNGKCEEIGEIESLRWSLLAKKIEVWRCVPEGG